MTPTGSSTSTASITCSLSAGTSAGFCPPRAGSQGLLAPANSPLGHGALRFGFVFPVHIEEPAGLDRSEGIDPGLLRVSGHAPASRERRPCPSEMGAGAGQRQVLGGRVR